jgi:hypothetical protein
LNASPGPEDPLPPVDPLPVDVPELDVREPTAVEELAPEANVLPVDALGPDVDADPTPEPAVVQVVSVAAVEASVVRPELLECSVAVGDAEHAREPSRSTTLKPSVGRWAVMEGPVMEGPFAGT